MLKCIGITLIFLLVYSCENDFLNRVPQGVVNNEEFYTSEEGLKEGVTAIYTKFKDEYEVEMVMGDLRSDDAIAGGDADNVDRLDLQRLVVYSILMDNSYVNMYWKTYYRMIYLSNLIINNGLKPNVSTHFVNEEPKGYLLGYRLVGEALFFRAYAHFMLTTIYGEVPIVDHILTPLEFKQSKRNMGEIWAQIEKDLKLAAQFLPLKSEYSAADKARISKTAVWALMCRTLLYQSGEFASFNGSVSASRWIDIDKYCDSILNLVPSEHELEPNYGTLFTDAADLGKESIFEKVQVFNETYGIHWHDKMQSPRYYAQIVGVDTIRKDSWGWGFNCPTQSLYNEFEEKDFRRKYTIWEPGDSTGFDPGPIFFDNPTGYYNRKTTPIKKPQTMAGGINQKIFRLAEIYLIKAEAAYSLGNSDWYKYIEIIRDRAGLKGIISPYIDDPIKAIMHERRCELAMEGHRFFDLIRTNSLQQIIDAKDAFVWPKNKFIPIPRSEIESQRPNLLQNPYY